MIFDMTSLTSNKTELTFADLLLRYNFKCILLACLKDF